MPRVLPYAECPGAAPNASRMAGTDLRTMRTEVLQRLRATDCCTHLNDGLRSLAEVPVLAARCPTDVARRRSLMEGSAMPETLKDKTAIVGIGATPYYKRGESLPQTELDWPARRSSPRSTTLA